MPAVTRIGDLDVTHCSPPMNAQGSGTVFANGIGVSRKGDAVTTHMMPNPGTPPPPCVPHSSTISQGSGKVFANGIGVARIGDSISACTSVAQGSNNVFAG